MSASRRAAALLGMVLAAALSLYASPAAAHDGVTVAIVDVQRLLRESMAGQSIETQREQLRAAFRSEIRQKQQALLEVEQDLIARSAILSPEAMAEEQEKFVAEARALEQEIQSRPQGIDQAYAAAIATVREHVLQIIGNIVEERDIDVVLGRASYLIAKSSLDITDEVLSGLDSALPSVAVQPGE